MKKRTLVEFVLAALLFVGAVFLAPPNFFEGSIHSLTGNVVFESKEDVQAELQGLLREDIFQTVGDGAKICLNIQDGEEMYSFKIRKRTDLFDVQSAEPECDGPMAEDITLSFKSSEDFMSFKSGLDMDYFLSDDVSERFHLWPSKFIESGGLVLCEQQFVDRYCPFINEQFTERQRRQLGIGCCGPDTEKPDFWALLLEFLLAYWWLLVILLVIIVIGAAAMFLLTSKEEDQPEDKTEQVYDYIKRSRELGFGDITIHEGLTNAGWDPRVIDAEFERIRKEDLSNYSSRFRRDR